MSCIGRRCSMWTKKSGRLIVSFDGFSSPSRTCSIDTIAPAAGGGGGGCCAKAIAIAPITRGAACMVRRY
jgi:hypothetical protein